MADLHTPAPAPAKRALPFKRTARPKPPSDASAPTDDDGLSLFSQSKNYFSTVAEDQQRRAQEKAEAEERERKEKLAREAELKRERERGRRAAEEEAGERESARKRRRHSLLSEDEDPKAHSHEDNDDIFADKHSKPYRPATPPSTATRHDAPAPGSSRVLASARTARHETPVILLDSSDDDDDDDDDPTKRGSDIFTTSSRRWSSGSSIGGVRRDSDKGKAKATAADGDSDLEMWEDKKEDKEGADGEGEEDPSEYYIKAAMERMRRAKEARLAREASAAAGDGDKNKAGTPGIDDDRGAPVSVMIAAPALPDAKPLCCTVRTAQALQIAFDTFKERQKVQTAYPHKLISELVFTWRGDRVYHTTKLETLGIRPRGADGRLHDNTHGGRGAPEGYVGRDKVYFEAWTPEDYEENQQKRERERKRREMGEWWDQDEGGAPNDGDNGNGGGGGGGSQADAEAQNSQQKEDDRVRVIFKARDMPPRNVTLRKHSTVAHMIKAFRKLSGLPEDKHVEIRWDGEALDIETTVEEADIADMDSVEVHVR